MRRSFTCRMCLTDDQLCSRLATGTWHRNPSNDVLSIAETSISDPWAPRPAPARSWLLRTYLFSQKYLLSNVRESDMKNMLLIIGGMAGILSCLATGKVQAQVISTETITHHGISTETISHYTQTPPSIAGATAAHGVTVAPGQTITAPTIQAPTIIVPTVSQPATIRTTTIVPSQSTSPQGFVTTTTGHVFAVGASRRFPTLGSTSLFRH